jgi:transcription antitermination protein NusB
MAGPHESRRAARKRALDLLYRADLTDRPIAAVLADALRDGADEDDPAEGGELSEFALSRVRGVARHRDDLDRLIEGASRSWTMARMPVVDRNLLRLGLFEILHDDDVPTPVAIDEAVELAKELSTDDSPRFINGVLATLADAHAATPEAHEPAPTPAPTPDA